MLPLHTQKSLDKLTWNEIQKLHSSLGLKATATTRTRRDYQRRIVESQPQPVAAESLPTVTCATCPFSRLIEDNRYCCQVSQTASDVKRGHWEATVSCHEALAKLETETQTEEVTAAETETAATNGDKTPPNRGDSGRRITLNALATITEKEKALNQEKATPKRIIFNYYVYTHISDPVHSGGAAPFDLLVLNNKVIGRVVETQKLWSAWSPNADKNRWMVVYALLPSKQYYRKQLSQIIEDGYFLYRPDGFPSPSSHQNGFSFPQLSTENIIAMSTDMNTDTIAIPHANVEDNLIMAMTKETEAQKQASDLAYLYELEMKAQLAIEVTPVGSEDEEVAYRHLRRIEKEIEGYNKPQPIVESSPIIIKLEQQMTELKRDLRMFSITPFDPAILPTNVEPEQPATESVEAEGTIHWENPQRGTITGKKGTRHFFIQGNDIHLIISPDFTARESKNPNVRHRQIRDAINAGKRFDSRTFKHSPTFWTETEDYKSIGRLLEGVDGRWWAWADSGYTGHSFFDKVNACNYLESMAQRPIARNH